MADIIDVENQANQETPETEYVLDKADYDELLKLGMEVEELHTHVGGLEVRKQEILSHIFRMRNEIDKKAKQSIILAGVSEETVEQYKIDLQTGKIVKR